MDAKAVRKALRSLGTRRSAERAAPLMSDEARRRLGITIQIDPDPPKKEEDDDPDAETHGYAFDDDPVLPGRTRKRRRD